MTKIAYFDINHQGVQARWYLKALQTHAKKYDVVELDLAAIIEKLKAKGFKREEFSIRDILAEPTDVPVTLLGTEEEFVVLDNLKRLWSLHEQGADVVEVRLMDRLPEPLRVTGDVTQLFDTVYRW